MDILNEVEDLFRKLEAVPIDIKEAAFKKIIERISCEEDKKKDFPSIQDSIGRERKEDKEGKNLELFKIKLGNDPRGYIVENILTSRGRKAQRLCQMREKHGHILEDSKKSFCGERVCHSKDALDVDENSCNTQDTLHVDKKKLIDNVNEISFVVSNETPAEYANLKLQPGTRDFIGKSKLESSFEESQLVIVDAGDGHESTLECNQKKCDELQETGLDEKDFSDEESVIEGVVEVNKKQETSSSCVESNPKHKEKALTCKHSSRQAFNNIHLHSHKRKYAQTGLHKCLVCGKVFSQSSSLRNHSKRHRGQRDFPCDYGCSYRAFTKVEKMRHMTLHSGERSQQCHYCGKLFAKDSTLRDHEKSIHERSKKHTCTTCGFSTYRASNLRVHISMRHRGEYNNHICPVCNAKVKQRAGFLDHMRTHTGERPFQCSVCDKSFTCVARLTVHHKAVHGPREYLCNFCQKSFQTKHHMKRHELTHTNQKPFACPFCSYSCNTQGNVTKHVKRVHNKPDFSYRKYKADQQVHSDYKVMKTEWIEKGEKLTAEYLRDLSKKLGKEVTLSELKKREAEKKKCLADDGEQAKKRRMRKQEHDYHSKALPENEECGDLEEQVDEPTAILLNVSPCPTNCIVSSTQGESVPGQSESHVFQKAAVNHSTQCTLLLQTPAHPIINDVKPTICDKMLKEGNCKISVVPEDSIQFCMNDSVPLDDQIPLRVIYSPQITDNACNMNLPTNINGSKYGNNFNLLEVKRDARNNQTVVVIINADNP